jgi:hypothetical protein
LPEAVPPAARRHPRWGEREQAQSELALRLLTTRATDFETWLTGLVGELVDGEAAAGRLDAAIPQEDLPYVLVRIMESYIYLGLITGEHTIPTAPPGSSTPSSRRQPAAVTAGTAVPKGMNRLDCSCRRIFNQRQL